jgi:hypothetical protein
MSALTLEQQKDIVRRMEEGYRWAREMREEEARRMTPEQRWAAIEAVQGFAELFPSPPSPPFDPEGHGLVLQQRRFASLRALR